MLYAQAVLHLFASVGYLGLAALLFLAALGIGAPIPVTALLLVTGALSGTQGGPNAVAVAVLAVLGLTCGHATDYLCGRLGTRVFAPRLSRALDRLNGVRQILESPRSTSGRTLLLFLSRFILTPVASPVSLFAGVIRMPVGLYLALETAGTAVYVAGNLLLGHLFGPHAFGGGGLILFWLVVAGLTLLPIALIRRVSRPPVQVQPPAAVLRIRRNVVRRRSANRARAVPFK
jgi:membrane-associated protein